MNGDQNQQPGNLPGGNSPTGGQQGGGQFSAAPPKEVNIRSAESDNASIERGDAAPTPESVAPPMPGGSEPNFSPETGVSDDFSGEVKSGGGSRKIWLWIFVGVMVIAVGVVGYIVYPLIFGESKPEPTTQLPPPPPPALVHQSFFVPAPLNNTEVRLSNVSYSTILNAFQAAAETPTADDTLREIIMLDGESSQIPFATFLSTMVPGLDEQELATWFEDDFSTFIYHNAQGKWPGFVARIKNGANLEEAKLAMKALEAADLSRFYLGPPGTFGAFKDGQINGKPTRFAGGSEAGAAFNYGFVGNYFVMSSSYAGLQAVAPLLGI
jgi:hypothetical protein